MPRWINIPALGSFVGLVAVLVSDTPFHNWGKGVFFQGNECEDHGARMRAWLNPPGKMRSFFAVGPSACAV